MEVVIPVPGMSSTPSSPRRFGQYFFTSAPTSPTRISEYYREFDNFYMINESRGSARTSVSSSAVPFNWEEKPGTPKSPKSTAAAFNEDDFAFDFSEDLVAASLSAEELFDGGKIRPLKPPPRLQLDEYNNAGQNQKSPLLSPRSPRSPRSPISQGKRIIREAFSPRTKKQIDPFATAIENTRKKTENERGRDRTAAGLSSSSSRRATRSLSPFRVSAYPWDEEDHKQQQQQHQQQQQPPTKQQSFSLTSSKGSSRKWRLRDFLLFRSASEGRAKGRDPFMSKYVGLFKKNDDNKNASFRSTDSSGSASGSKRRGPVSAHELHYTKNKAAHEDMKKKTFLPYKQGILGSWVSHKFMK
ncbi:hypothetical protein ACOSQ4_010903 [Xanthoceras sorbifolium]